MYLAHHLGKIEAKLLFGVTTSCALPASRLSVSCPPLELLLYAIPHLISCCMRVGPSLNSAGACKTRSYSRSGAAAGRAGIDNQTTQI